MWEKENAFGDQDSIIFLLKMKKDEDDLRCVLSEGNTHFLLRFIVFMVAFKLL